MKKCYGYIRVSTAKQGTQGVSLQEQKDAISRYAGQNAIEILDWFEERETAAKAGRPVFGRMLAQLRKGSAQGVVIHKIDRSARNLRDWANLGELIDQGIDVYFANESLDLRSRGGRLSADIQAVVAADYIRNLREEARKGLRGRLKQGIYPFRAPIGYVDNGGGKVKTIDSAKAPLVKQAFQLYAGTETNVRDLAKELHGLGLRNRRGGNVTRNGVAMILKNSFYIGLMRLPSSGEVFQGIHEPLIDKRLFDRVQQKLKGKRVYTAFRHEYLFRRLFACAGCGYSLVGERQKGHIYYRCQTSSCQTKTVREEVLDTHIRKALAPIMFSTRQLDIFELEARHSLKWLAAERLGRLRAQKLKLEQVERRLARLTDLYLDGNLDQQMFDAKKQTLFAERIEAKDEIGRLENDHQPMEVKVRKFLELLKTAERQYEIGTPQEKRDLVMLATSNRTVDGKDVAVKLSPFFQHVAMTASSIECGR